MKYLPFSEGAFESTGLPSFKTGRIANGTGDSTLGFTEGMGPKDQGQGKSDRAKRNKSKRRKKVDVKKIRGM